MSANPPEAEMGGSTTGAPGAPEGPAAETQAAANLSDEFREFGRQMAALLRVIRESPRAKEIETQVTQAMRDLERQMNEALATAREKTQVQDWKGTIKGAASTAADETQRGLARGLHSLNERMAKAVQEAERNRTASTAPGPGNMSGDGGPSE